MATIVINTKIGSAKGGISRIWLEGQKLLCAGVRIGQKYVLRADEQAKRFELVPGENKDESRAFTVSKRERNGVVTPLLEIRTDLIAAFFEGCEKVRVAIRNGRIVVSALLVDMKIKERVDRLKRKLAAKEKLATGSLFSGGGVLDKALHSGLMAAGLAAFIQVGVEAVSEYIDSSLRNNPELWSDESIVINSDVRDVPMSGAVPQLEVVCGGGPCTGASRAGASKNKLAFAEEHSSAGTLFFDYLEFVKASNPAVVLLENVPEYAKSASMAVVRSVLTSLGYDLYEQVFNGNDFGVLEARKRLVLVGITKGFSSAVPFEFPSSHPCVQPGHKPTVADILEDVPLDSPMWKSYDYLEAKQVRDSEAGKGFKRQLVTAQDTSYGTIGRGYQKARSTEPFLLHPTDPTLSRLFTPGEHAAGKGIPVSVIDGVAATTAHEILGQSVIYPKFEAIGYAIGSFLTGSEMASEYVATSDGVTDFCSQVCGGGQCGTGPSCHLGIDPVTRQPATMVPDPQGHLNWIFSRLHN